MVLVPGNSAGWNGGKDEDNNPKLEQDKKKPVEGKKPVIGGNPFENAKTWQAVPERPKKIPQPAFIAQRSAIFGDEFPSLGRTGLAKDGQPPAAGGPAQQALANEVKYGPGPSLRPQTSGNWLHGGKGPGGPPTEDDAPMGGGFRPEKPQFDVSTSAKPFQMHPQGMLHHPKKGMDSRRGGPGPMNDGPSNRFDGRGRGRSPHHESMHQASIIDNEKLRRMDYIESNDDDWTKSDDNFDYNKKLAR